MEQALIKASAFLLNSKKKIMLFHLMKTLQRVASYSINIHFNVFLSDDMIYELNLAGNMKLVNKVNTTFSKFLTHSLCYIWTADTKILRLNTETLYFCVVSLMSAKFYCFQPFPLSSLLPPAAALVRESSHSCWLCFVRCMRVSVTNTFAETASAHTPTRREASPWYIGMRESRLNGGLI